MDQTRRKTLYGSSLVALAALAGCLEDDPGGDPLDGAGGNGDDDDGNGDDGTDDGDEDDETDPDDEGGDHGEAEYTLTDYDTYTYSLGGGETGAEPFYSESDAAAVLEDGSLSDETREGIEGFLEGTDFETSKVVFLSVETPTPCYDLELETVDVDDDGVVIEATAVGEDGGDEACPHVIQFLQMLLRTEFDGEVPTSGSIELTDGTGASHGIGYDSDTGG